MFALTLQKCDQVRLPRLLFLFFCKMNVFGWHKFLLSKRRLRIKCMRNLPVLLFESVSLFFLLNFPPQLSVDAVSSAFALVLQAVLDDTSHVSE